jgi:hypothetical protein
VYKGIVSGFMPTHEQHGRQALRDRIFNLHPERTLDAIRNYFGEKIALYFAWAMFYTKWLFIPSLLGALLFFAQVATRDPVRGLYVALLSRSVSRFLFA